ncbi:AAA family ATPase, partial [Candidatus Poribacteria bacterium]|nr:AAA family ATPase [Candidatus Poribacteria bacterium]
MKLTKVRIKNFQCIHDSTEFDIGDITCLVGKNESGKTAILKALHKFNPFDTTPGFERPNDYPVENNQTENDVVEVTFSLEQKDIDRIEEFITCKCLNAGESTITLSNGYSNTIKVVKYGFEVDTDAIISHVSTEANVKKLNPSITDPTKIAKEFLAELDPSENQPHYSILEALASSNLRDLIYNSILSPKIPKFIYSDEYHQMSSVVNINQLFGNMQGNQTQPADQPIAEILKSAEVNFNHIINSERDNDYGIAIRKAKSAIDKVLNEIFKSWSQHEIYSMESEIVRATKEDDPTLRIYITDGRKAKEGYLTRKPFESESHGFIWFFSFLMMQKHFYSDNNDVKCIRLFRPQFRKVKIRF